MLKLSIAVTFLFCICSCGKVKKSLLGLFKQTRFLVPL